MDTAKRTIYNPIQKDSVLFIETFTESNGKHTLVEVDMAAGGGNGLHYHKTLFERFECLEGELKVQTGKTIHTLKQGDVVTAEPFVIHRFFNDSDKPCKFRVLISPGSRGFEETLQIAYGIARDGIVNKKGMPAKLSHLAVLLDLSETNLPGWQSIIGKVLKWVSRRAEKRGVTAALRKKYVKI